ncbi:hypothetical protein LYNGBM3L_25620 [Moorena producens 3L]|uniref:Uncharacterized protein n=1 Tax=Moorena producens 3L TaxID=489825 RepID=F4XNZ6_9CYAN|nr:hypothetical protein LYNGBM3L_25620 [Moorena producens 3L]OLT64499.1 hypothetical protein BI334_05190 [Moorena producens 3L]
MSFNPFLHSQLAFIGDPIYRFRLRDAPTPRNNTKSSRTKVLQASTLSEFNGLKVRAPMKFYPSTDNSNYQVFFGMEPHIRWFSRLLLVGGG